MNGGCFFLVAEENETLKEARSIYIRIVCNIDGLPLFVRLARVGAPFTDGDTPHNTTVQASHELEFRSCATTALARKAVSVHNIPHGVATAAAAVRTDSMTILDNAGNNSA